MKLKKKKLLLNDATFMISTSTINQAAKLLLENIPGGSQLILFGSQARATSNNESDADFLVIEPSVLNRHTEMVRLRQILRPLRIPVDIVVVSRAFYENWKEIPDTVVYDAYKEGINCGIAA